MIPVFFVGKKNRKKRMVQDYQYLNEQTVKNNYLLPLISDIIKNIRTKKVFTKLDLRWEYKNVRIKKGDKWKVAFIIPEELFEPTVMFFGLTNSPAIFQAIINEFLKDLINMGKMGSFINDVIVGTESKEKHNELVEEILRRIEEDNLYIKPKKCKWKVREVDFLEVIIGLEEMKIKKEKVKAVLDQPVSKLVKNIQKFLELANYYRRFVKDFVKIAKLLWQPLVTTTNSNTSNKSLSRISSGNHKRT